MIQLQTLGHAAAHRDGEALDDLTSHPDAFALLVHLCVEGPSSRRRLAELWPGDPKERDRALEDAVRAARKAAGPDVVVEEAGHLRCADGAVRCDAGRLEDAAAEGDWVTVDRLDRGRFLPDLPIPEGGWSRWRADTDAHLTRLGRRAASELRAAGEPSGGQGPGPRSPSWTHRMLEQLKARHVFQVAAIYVAAAWAGLQAVDTLIQRDLLPEWAFVTGLGLGAVGLVVVVSVAWLQESEALMGPDDDYRGPRWVRQAATRHLVAGLGVTAVLLLGAFVVLRSTLRDTPAASDGPPDLREIAVLYFDDHSVDQDLQPVAAGFTDELIHLLSQVPALEVPSRNAVKRYRDGEVTLDSLLTSLEVGAYVEGSVTRAGDSLRVNAQLIDATRGRHVESTTLTASLDDVLLLRDQLAEEIARILRRRLGTEIRLRERRADADDPEAWLMVQRAERRRDDAEALARSDQAAARRALEAADSLLALAESRDPDWVTPVVLRGWTATDRALLETDLPGNYDPGWGRRALEHARRAVSMSGGHPEALELRGRVRFELAEVLSGTEADSLYARGERDLEAAVAEDATRARAWVTLSDLYQRRAQFAEAQRAAEQALAADYYLTEGPEVTLRLWHTALELEEADEASRWCREGRRRWPARAAFLQCKLLSLASYPGSPEEVDDAWATLDSMVAVTAEGQRDAVRNHGLMWLAQAAAGVGLADSARAIIRRARGPEPDPALAYNEAHARVRMGEEERALDLLELHVRHFPNRGGEYLAGDWWFRELRGHPRFRALVENGPT